MRYQRLPENYIRDHSLMTAVNRQPIHVGAGDFMVDNEHHLWVYSHAPFFYREQPNSVRLFVEYGPDGAARLIANLLNVNHDWYWEIDANPWTERYVLIDEIQGVHRALGHTR